MELYQIKRRINIAVNLLRVNDDYLLKNDVNERSITHKLAMYLSQCFGTYDVDCEYNRNVEDPSNSKKIRILAEELNEIDCNNIERSINEDRIEKSVYPDIIVHKRGSNGNNLLVVEVKKSTSRVSKSYDFQKLKSYTDSRDEEGLRYTYGVFIRVYTKQEKYKEPEIIFFKNGREI